MELLTIDNQIKEALDKFNTEYIGYESRLHLYHDDLNYLHVMAKKEKGELNMIDYCTKDTEFIVYFPYENIDSVRYFLDHLENYTISLPDISAIEQCISKGEHEYEGHSTHYKALVDDEDGYIFGHRIHHNYLIIDIPTTSLEDGLRKTLARALEVLKI